MTVDCWLLAVDWRSRMRRKIFMLFSRIYVLCVERLNKRERKKEKKKKASTNDNAIDETFPPFAPFPDCLHYHSFLITQRKPTNQNHTPKQKQKQKQKQRKTK